jgi:hypothetical protein
MKDNEISTDGFFESSYVADQRNADGNRMYSPWQIAIQVLFDQHLTVDIELSSGVLHKAKHVRPATVEGFIWLSSTHDSGVDPVSGRILVPISAIAAVHFQEKYEYLMTQPK